MNDICTHMIELLPERGLGTLSAEDANVLERHLAQCERCSAEAEFVALVGATRPEPPPTLIGQIEDALDAELAARRSPNFRRRAAPWTWSAAAALVMALGTGLVWQQLRPSPIVVAGDELQPVPESWLMDDAVVAGAPLLDDLSDEDLSALLEEVGG